MDACSAGQQAGSHQCTELLPCRLKDCPHFLNAAFAGGSRGLGLGSGRLQDVPPTGFPDHGMTHCDVASHPQLLDAGDSIQPSVQALDTSSPSVFPPPLLALLPLPPLGDALGFARSARWTRMDTSAHCLRAGWIGCLICFGFRFFFFGFGPTSRHRADEINAARGAVLDVGVAPVGGGGTHFIGHGGHGLLRGDDLWPGGAVALPGTLRDAYGDHLHEKMPGMNGA